MISKEEQDNYREMLEANRREAMIAAGKRSEYMKAQVLQYGPQFWERMNALANSEDPGDNKLFVQEFGKLASKSMAQEVSGLNGGEISVVVNRFAPQDTTTPTPSTDNNEVNTNADSVTTQILSETVPVGDVADSEEV